MKKFISAVFLICIGLFPFDNENIYAKEIHHIVIDGVINPISSQFIIDAVSRAEKENAEAIIIELDTPGGLLEATRQIVQKFMAAEVPVVVYVSPSGARAGSAGVFITLASHVAVMAPGTNIGAAHPVTIGGGGMPSGGEQDTSGSGVMTQKMTNDAVAMVRAIAEQRGRNIEWAEKSVSKSESITDKDALEIGVIDLISASLSDLLKEIDGRIIVLKSGERILSTKGAVVKNFEMSWQKKLLNRLADPNIAYIFMMIGIYGIIFELSNPGSMYPGIIGGISLLLAFLAFQTLPLNAVGVLLLLIGIVMLVLEIKIPSYGALSVGGVISLILGSIMLIDSPVPEMRVSISVIIPSVIFLAVLILFVVSLALKAQRNKISIGQEALIGMHAEVLEDSVENRKVSVFVNGEYWGAICKSPLKKGALVKVTEMNGMLLTVEPIS